MGSEGILLCYSETSDTTESKWMWIHNVYVWMCNFHILIGSVTLWTLGKTSTLLSSRELYKNNTADWETGLKVTWQRVIDMRVMSNWMDGWMGWLVLHLPN